MFVVLAKPRKRWNQSIAIVADKLKLGTIAIESDVMTIGFLQKVQEQAKNTMFIMSSGLIDQLRVIKDRTEIAEIRYGHSHRGTGLARYR